MQGNYEYKAVSCENDQNSTLPNKKNSRTPLLRQLMIAGSYWILCVICGLCLGGPTVIIPQLRREANSTDAVSTEMAIWLSSVVGYAAIPWVIILSIMMSYFGRRNTFIFVSFGMIGIFICYIISTTPIHLLITQVLQGMPHGASMTLGFAIAIEYSTPRYRGVFLPLKSAMFHWGIWISNAIGTFLPWKYFAVFGLVCALCTLNVFFWPKSPFWLASTGRYEECRQAYRWFAGDDDASERELENIIASQIKRRKNRNGNRKNIKTVLSFLWMEEFYKPVLLTTLLIIMYLLSGKQVCVVYAIDILKELTASESDAYTGLNDATPRVSRTDVTWRKYTLKILTCLRITITT